MLAAGPETGRTRASVEHQVELSAENLWEEISGRLREALSDGTYNKWFGDVHGLELDGDADSFAVRYLDADGRTRAALLANRPAEAAALRRALAAAGLALAA